MFTREELKMLLGCLDAAMAQRVRMSSYQQDPQSQSRLFEFIKSCNILKTKIAEEMKKHGTDAPADDPNNY